MHVAKDLAAREDWVAAWTVCNQVLTQTPDRPEALFLMGFILREQGNIGLAYQCLRRALADDTARKQINCWMAYGACLHHLCRYDEAIEAYTAAHRIEPGIPEPLASIAACYVQIGKAREANEFSDKALKLSPDNHVARIAKAFACLCLGRWSEAWQHKEFLYGPQLDVRLYHKPGQPAEPQWDGTKGQTVVVQCDQGLGDQIMFSQCLPAMIQDCKRVIIECSKRMEGFFKHNFPGVHVYGTLKEAGGLQWPMLYEIDAHTHISFLGKWYLRGDHEFRRTAYVKPHPEKLAKWRQWLSAFPRPWVGLSWVGGIKNTQREWRSIALAQLEPIIKTGGTMVDMSYTDNGLEVSRWNLHNDEQIVRPPIDVEDYEDTIALAAALDDVVTVTTTLAHVCGALGRHAYVLVPAVAQWRYAYRYGDSAEMIWYPPGSVKLYRQKHGEPWGHAINRMAEDFRAIAQLRWAA